MKLSEKRLFITWERVAIAMMGLIAVLIPLVGGIVRSEIENFRGSIEELNKTLHDIRIELAANSSQFNAQFKAVDDRLNRDEQWIKRLSDRIRNLESK